MVEAALVIGIVVIVLGELLNRKAMHPETEIIGLQALKNRVARLLLYRQVRLDRLAIVQGQKHASRERPILIARARIVPGPAHGFAEPREHLAKPRPLLD